MRRINLLDKRVELFKDNYYLFSEIAYELKKKKSSNKINKFSRKSIRKDKVLEFVNRDNEIFINNRARLLIIFL